MIAKMQKFPNILYVKRRKKGGGQLFYLLQIRKNQNYIDAVALKLKRRA